MEKAGKRRGQEEFKEMWITDELEYDIDDPNAFLGDETTEGGLIKALEDERKEKKAFLLDTTENGDAPLMAESEFKLDNNGDPDNRGAERGILNLSATVDGMQKPEDVPAYKRMIGIDGLRKNCYHVDRRLSIVEYGKAVKLMVNPDGTNNKSGITVITGTSVGDKKEIYVRRPLWKTLPSLDDVELIDPEDAKNFPVVLGKITVPFKWQRKPSATGYIINITDGAAFNKSIDVPASGDSEETHTEIIEPVGGLPVTYSWTIKAVRGDVEGTESATRTFLAVYAV